HGGVRISTWRAETAGSVGWAWRAVRTRRNCSESRWRNQNSLSAGAVLFFVNQLDLLDARAMLAEPAKKNHRNFCKIAMCRGAKNRFCNGSYCRPRASD